ncbi:phosphoglycerate mutase-like protein [Saccharata proteae CBS 121410]|uniref:Phosphoglycerate mutase-like protein n=1 Tax=Saccharata proteae CBS 121410 TaxID=1314787 RepID=A0A9P4HR38_9PEZI|nr:phosphoglycerate mutase-like protein [Saccharata proteae CBS 121410]
MSRHAERYPTIKAGSRMLDMLDRVKATNITLQGDLAFLNSWQFFTASPQTHFEQLTTTGPYAGTLSAFTTGVRLRTRYAHLLPHRLSHGKKTSFWAGDSPRVIDTARYFAAGFFGLDWPDTATLHVIPETLERGGNTLTPGDSCLAYIEDEEFGHDYGARMLMAYRSTYLSKVRERLQTQNPGIVLSDADIYSMQEMCGFETTVRGASPWCDVFSEEEWRDFEYARDVIHYYRAGPGNRWAGAMGWLWLNRTAELLEGGPAEGPLWFSFVHDGDIVPMLAALDLFPQAGDLPTTHRIDDRGWKTSQVTPMGGRAIFERLRCPKRPSNDSAAAEIPREEANGSAGMDEIFVRININDGIVALPDCSSGPGGSCPLADFLRRIGERGEEVGDFRTECGLGGDAEAGIGFLMQ